MRRSLAWVAGIFIAGGFALGLARLSTAPSKVAKPELIPGQYVVIHVGKWTIEGTYAPTTLTPNTRVLEAFHALEDAGKARQRASDNGARG